MRLSAEWGVSGTLSTPHSPSYAPKPGALLSFLLQGFSGLWEAWDTSLCSSFLPPIAHSAGPRLFPEAPSPLPPRGPLARGFGPTHFLCRPNSALSRGGKFLSSRRAAPPPSFPAGQESPKRVGRGVGLPGLRPEKGSDSSAVTQPQPRLSQLGTLRGERKDSHPATANTFSHSETPAPPAGGEGGPHLPKTPLSSRLRAKQSEHRNTQSIYLSMSPGGWPLNLNIQHGALALPAVGGCRNGS